MILSVTINSFISSGAGGRIQKPKFLGGKIRRGESVGVVVLSTCVM